MDQGVDQGQHQLCYGPPGVSLTKSLHVSGSQNSYFNTTRGSTLPRVRSTGTPLVKEVLKALCC